MPKKTVENQKSDRRYNMEYFYDYLIAAGVSAEAASWGTVGLVLMLVGGIIRLVFSICK
jgi:hypothetical protein